MIIFYYRTLPVYGTTDVGSSAPLASISVELGGGAPDCCYLILRRI